MPTKATIKIEVQGKDAEKQIKNISNAFEKMGAGAKKGEKQTKNLATHLFKLGIASLGAKTAFDGLKSTISEAAAFEQTQIAFETLIGDTELAQQKLQELQELALKTTFDLPGVERNAKLLIGMGIEVDKVIPTMKSLGDVAAGLNVPLERIALNFGQVKSQGKLTGRELRDFAIAGVPLMETLAETMGKTTKEISAMVSEGKIGFEDVETAFTAMTSEGGKFANMNERLAGTTKGLASNLGVAADLLKREFGEGFLQLGQIFIPIATNALNILTEAIKNDKESWEDLKKTMDGYLNINEDIATQNKLLSAALKDQAKFQKDVSSATKNFIELKTESLDLNQDIVVKTKEINNITQKLKSSEDTLSNSQKERLKNQRKNLRIERAEMKKSFAEKQAALSSEFDALDEVEKKNIDTYELSAIARGNYSAYIQGLSDEERAKFIANLEVQKTAAINLKNNLISFFSEPITQKINIVSGFLGGGGIGGAFAALSQKAREFKGPQITPEPFKAAGGGGGGGKSEAMKQAEKEAKERKKLLDETKFYLKKYAEDVNDLENWQIEVLKNTHEKNIDIQKEKRENLKDLQVEYKDFQGNASESLLDLAQDHEQSMARSAESMLGLKQEIKGLEKAYSEDLASAAKESSQTIAEEYVNTEAKIKEINASLQEELTGAQKERLEKEKTELQKNLDSVANIEKKHKEEIEEVRRRSSLTNLERLSEDQKTKEDEIKKEFEIEKEEKDTQLQELRDQRKEEKDLYEKKVDFIKSSERDSNLIIKDALKERLSITKDNVDKIVKELDRIRTAREAAFGAETTGQFQTATRQIELQGLGSS